MTECMRCKTPFQWKHPLDAVCPPCFEANPHLATAERSRMNIWDRFSDFLAVYVAMKAGHWSWAQNTSCKYIELQIDMRDGGCIIRDKTGERIGPDRLAWQYSKETPNPPNT